MTTICICRYCHKPFRLGFQGPCSAYTHVALQCVAETPAERMSRHTAERMNPSRKTTRRK